MTYRILQSDGVHSFYLNLPPLSEEQAKYIAQCFETHGGTVTWKVEPHPSMFAARQDTLSVTYTEFGTTLARWCLESKMWYRYSDGRYLKGVVTLFLPLHKAQWYEYYPEGEYDTDTLYLAQTVSGRYVLVNYTGQTWMCASNDHVLREGLNRLVRVKDMEDGTWKNG
jgi:hypothetical protein